MRWFLRRPQAILPDAASGTGSPGGDATSPPDVDAYKARTERYAALHGFANQNSIWSSDGLRDALADHIDDADATSARTLALIAAFRAMRRIADES